MSANTGETTIEAVPDLPIIRIVREFDAPPERVFDAHVDIEKVKRWLACQPTTMQRWDAKTGGSYRYTHTDKNGEYRFYGSFHEVRAPDRIVQTFTWEGTPEAVFLETLTLTGLSGGRTRLVMTSLTYSIEGRDAMLASGMDVGVKEGYEKLDKLLAST